MVEVVCRAHHAAGAEFDATCVARDHAPAATAELESVCYCSCRVAEKHRVAAGSEADGCGVLQDGVGRQQGSPAAA